MNRLLLLLLFLSLPALVLYGVVFDVVAPSSLTQWEPAGDMRENEMDLQEVVFESLSKEAMDIEQVGSLIQDTADLQNFYNGSLLLREQHVKLLTERAVEHRNQSDDLYETRIVRLLGQPIEQKTTDKADVQVYTLAELGYKGFIAKVKLFDPTAMRVALADGQVNGLETVSGMAKANEALFAVNGGGFGIEYKGTGAISHMIGVTVVEGQIVKSYAPNREELFFAGINDEGDLVGTILKSNLDVEVLEPKDGVSFIPVLIQGGDKVDLPAAWAGARHPRTVFGKYANGDLIFIVIDGRQGNYSIGATLERLQDKLIQLGVRDAYNLDGGGSSTFYYGGEVLNRPSDGRERPVANSFILVP